MQAINHFCRRRLAGLVVASVLAMASTASFAASANGDATLVQKGKYLTTAADCAACHTARDGKPYAGGRAVATPFGKIYSSNITPDDATGIGSWDFDDFWDALHSGRGKHGELLYPAFPYTSYTKIKRDDAKAIFAYLESLPAVYQKDRKHSLGFPYNVRSGLHVWRMLYFDQGEFKPDPDKSDQWNRGAYLVDGLGHCNECHTARTWLGGMKDKNYLSGGQIPVQGWFAPDLSTQKGGGLEGWSKEDIVTLLKTGRSDKGSVYGPMADVVRHSTQHLSQDDLGAMAVYLASLPAPKDEAASADEKAPDYDQGKRLYADNCSSCHAQDGRGTKGMYPPLDGNSPIRSATGINAIRIVLMGGFSPSTKHNPEPYSMPPFANSLSNDDVAAVVNYIRQSWSNNAPAVSADDVAEFRYIEGN